MRQFPVFLGLVCALNLTWTLPSRAAWPMDGSAVCTVPTSAQTAPNIVPDGNGGAIVSWLDARGCLFAQRLSSAGVPQWADNGVQVCTGSTFLSALAPDGQGGAFVVWYIGGVHAQRIDANGNLLWQTQYDFLGAGSLNDAISDGGGRLVFAAFNPTGSSFIRVQCVGDDGTPQWTTSGVIVEAGAGTLNFRWFPRLAPDGAGGTIATWYTNGALSGYDVHAQHVNASGVAMWSYGGSTDGGVPITDAGPEDYDPQIVPDGAGGAVIAWWQTDTAGDIYAQRVDASGARLWTPNGVPVCTLPNAQNGVFLAPDGAAGAILVWVDKRTGVDTDIYAQRVDGAGSPQWASNGVAICDLPANQNASRVVADNAGGAFIVWADQRNGAYDIYSQHVDASGVVQWDDDGVRLCVAAGNQTVPQIALVASGDAIAAWQDARSGNNDVYAQRMTLAGPTGVGDAPRFARLGLDPSAPNPFSGVTELRIRLAVESDVRADIHDVTGRRVSTRALGHLTAGQHAVPLADRDDHGRLLPSGVYFCRVHAAGESVVQKITIVR